VDSIMVTLVMLGPVFAVVRPIAAFVSGVLGGVAVEAATGADEGDDAPDEAAPDPAAPSCAAGSASRSALLRAAHYGFVSLPSSIGRGLIIGILLAGVISAVIPDDFFAATLGTGFVSMLVMLAAGIPTYVCATASVPVAAAMMAKGVSPGAALVFLMTGPATNAATIAVLWNALGRTSAVIYLIAVAGSALMAGAVMNAFILPSVPDSVMQAAHAAGTSPVEWISAVLLAGVLLYALRPRPAGGEAASPTGKPEINLTVKGMTCGHCAEAVRSELMKCSGVDWVGVDLKKGRVSVSGSQLNPHCLLNAVKSAGFGGAIDSKAES
jgi:copper chaperone CopZ